VPKPPLTQDAVTMLRKPNPAVITTLRRDGQPVSVATWYLWDDGRVLVNMDESRKRLAHMRNDPRVARHYTGNPYPQRDRRRISAWIAVDGWHGWGALADGG
jgi:hypothetical protein